jgi:hypothetical protein
MESIMTDLRQVVTDLLDLSCAQEDPVFKVQGLRDAIKSSKDPEAVIAAFDMDPNFHTVFNSNGKNALENIENYLNASNEGFWQDFWHHGLIGAIFCHYVYEDLNKISRKLGSGINPSRDLENIRSIYLPDYDQAQKLLTILEGTQRVVESWVKNPNSDFGKTVDGLRQAGLNIKSNGKAEDYNTTAWASGIFGNMLASPINAMIAWIPIFGYANTVASGFGAGVGNVIMRRWLNKNGETIDKRGWTLDKLNDAARRAKALIEKLHTLSQAKVSAQNWERNDNNRLKIKFITTVIDVQTTALKRFGRAFTWTEGDLNVNEYMRKGE